MDLWCGSPAQRQTLIINTGGHGTAFPCTGCRNDCGEGYHIDHYFDETASLTFHQLSCDECVLGTCKDAADPSKKGTCTFGLSYEEGSSWFAVEVQDHCYIGGLHDKPVSVDGATDDLDPAHAAAYAFDLNFGCQTSISGLFRTQLADGILSMDNSPNSFWNQLYRAKRMQDELFSLCYAKQPHAYRNGTGAGAMTLGGSDDRLHVHPMVFSKHEDVWGRNYGVLLRKIHLRQGGGGDSARSSTPNLQITTLNVTAEVLNEGNVIIESGTTDTYMTSAMREEFEEVWKSMSGRFYSNEGSYRMTQDEIQSLPTIIFQFEGAEDLNKEVKDAINLAGDMDPEYPYDIIVAMPPNHYMEYLEDQNVYMARFYMAEHPSKTSILGANAMMGHDILFDAKNHRIGWAESFCNYDHLVKEAGFDPTGKSSKQSGKGGKGDKKYTPSDGNANEDNSTGGSQASSGACSSASCRAGMFILAASLLVFSSFYVRRQPGRLGSWIRRMTGGTDYRVTSINEFGDSELELQESYGESNFELS